MNGNIDIKVNGGAMALGNLVQGDHNTVTSGKVATRVEDAFRQFQAQLPDVARPFERPDEEVASLARQIEELKARATAAQPDVAGGAGLLKTIRENFSWAWPAVKDLAAVAWPAVLAALAG